MCNQVTWHRASTSTRWHSAFGALLSWQRNPFTDCKSVQRCTTRGHPPTIPPTYIQVRAVVWECGEGQTYTHKDTQTAVTEASSEMVRQADKQPVLFHFVHTESIKHTISHKM